MGRTVPESPGPNQLPLGGGQGQRLTAHGLFRKWSGFWKITQRERQRTITRKSGEGSRFASGASPSPASHHDATEDTENGENAYGLSGKYELNTTQSVLSPARLSGRRWWPPAAPSPARATAGGAQIPPCSARPAAVASAGSVQSPSPPPGCPVRRRATRQAGGTAGGTAGEISPLRLQRESF